MTVLYEGNCKFFHWRQDGGVSNVSIFFVFIIGVCEVLNAIFAF